MTQRLVLCIGTQKAGTTWLADYLRDHPDVHMPLVKEVHFFDARFLPQWCLKYEEEMLAEFQREVAGLTLATCGEPGLQQKLHAMLLRFRMIANPGEYLRFMAWGAQHRPVMFEATPDYCMLDAAAFTAMRDFHPDVRLVFLIRNPADRFWSSMRFNKTHVQDFDLDAGFDKFLTREDFMLLADYGRSLREIGKVFPRERVHVEFYERLFTQDAVDAICRFIGVAPRPAALGERSNASIAGAMTADQRARAVAAYSHVYRDMAAMFGGDLPETWRADLATIGG